MVNTCYHKKPLCSLGVLWFIHTKKQIGAEIECDYFTKYLSNISAKLTGLQKL
jgi:hypothetical protein